MPWCFWSPGLSHASVCSYEAYEYRTPRHDNVIIGLSAIDDISAAVVFCASSTTDDAHVSIGKLCLWLLLVWLMSSMFCRNLGLREFGCCLPWYPHLVIIASFSLLSKCSFILLDVLSLPLPFPQPFPSLVAGRAHTAILCWAFESLSASLVSP